MPPAPRRPRILVLCHEEQTSDDYFLLAAARVWEREGLDVAVVRGIGEHHDADVAINHVDLSVTPPEYLTYLDRFPVVINRRATDIRKSAYTTGLLCRDDDDPGPVVVKTDLNYGGRPEARALRKQRRKTLLGRLVTSRIFHPSRWRSRRGGYRLYPSLAEVPGWVFRDDSLVVQRFQPEMEGDLYACRVYTFLGDRHTNARLLSESPLVKGSNAVERKEVPVHPAIVAERERLGFDFGKFDYVVRDGDAVLFDANRTPAAPPFLHRTPEYVENVALGIRRFLAHRKARRTL